MFRISPTVSIAFEHYALRRYVSAERSKGSSGWQLVDIYIDVGSGSSVAKLPKLFHMISDIKCRNIETVVTKSISRFGRNAEDILPGMDQDAID
ncbi:MAG: recombinase family protein [Clostridia bacterium]|nr:recombinase family protein [Clostridia bacterium]